MKWKTVYLLFVHAVLVLVLCKSDFLPKLMPKLGLGWTVSVGFKDPIFSNKVLVHSSLDAQAPTGAIIFFGDSMMERFLAAPLGNPALNFGIGGDTTEGLLARIPFYPGIKRAEIAVIEIGINDLIRDVPMETIVQNYRKILEMIPAATSVIICAVFPVEELRNPKKFSGLNRRVQSLNKTLQSLALARPATGFLPVPSALLAGDGGLLPGMHIGNGLHLNEKAYAIWSSEMDAALKRISKQNP